jgi:RNA polymerase sigma-70 factor (ECF subfamily)
LGLFARPVIDYPSVEVSPSADETRIDKRTNGGGAADTGRVPDEDLMSRYAHGDTAAFEELFARYETRAYGFFYKRTRSEDRAQDLYQELFLRLHRSRRSYDPSSPFAPWFFTIAERLFIDDLRRGFRKHELPEQGQEASASDRDAEHSLGDVEEVEQLLRGLSAEEKHVLLSAKVEGVGYSELAKELGKSVDAVKKLASRALGRLRASNRPDTKVPDD